MKIGRISVPSPDGEVTRVVAVEPEAGRVIDLARAYSLALQRNGATPDRAREVSLALFPASLSNALAAGDAFLDRAHEALAAADDASAPIDSVSWRAAIDPPVIRDGLTFGTHIENYFKNVVHGKPVRAVYERPGFFKGNTATVYGHEEEVPYPSISEKLDYELEIGYIIGRPGRNLTPDDALSHVFGITIFNDWSLRDVQALESPIGMGAQHSKDFAYGIGPWITTLDEIESIEGLTGQVRVNGEVRSDTRVENFVYTPAELVAYVSLYGQLQVGDLIGSGTMGFGAGVEINRLIEPGDVVELELEGVGTLRNRLAGQKETTPWWPEPRPYPYEDGE
ncbi:fumarylacetoacetate hydrolase family protein [Leucobacter tenebrionis]|uniref:fumarylacetoacetate hydrolase family protein n=1 Tax=Leucobacter tenebrionis TaxID=2873270 RepID=UPI001CA67C5E|nr:fumarylacetoacetate hydrolase family protein [Leucobacter tenebrionis]QZY50628.1 fumarylacetoacetate hydrolase family protein [Leucobacter tenebrionis]